MRRPVCAHNAGHKLGDLLLQVLRDLTLNPLFLLDLPGRCLQMMGMSGGQECFGLGGQHRA